MKHYIMKTQMHQSGLAIDKQLEMFHVTPKIQIAALIMPGDTNFVQDCAISLAEYIKSNIKTRYDTIITAEFKGSFLAQQLAIELHSRGLISESRFVVARKSQKVYMGKTVGVKVKTITTNADEMLYLSQSDAEFLGGKRVLLVDDVISTGGAINALANLVDKVGGEYFHKVCVAVEGLKQSPSDVISLANIPLFDEFGNEIWCD